MDLREFAAGLPKVELHLHLVGAAPLPAVVELARRRPELGVPTDIDGLRRHYAYTDFADFIRVYKSVSNLVRDADDLAVLATAVARDLAAQSVRYAEITVTPLLHERRGLPPEAIRDGLDAGADEARRRHGVVLRWCYEIPAGSGPPAGLRTATMAERTPPDGLVSFGLGGVEAGFPRSDHRAAFELARALGLRSVPHAGEAAGAAHVWQAVTDLRADRIGHGIRAIDDPRLVDVLVERGIALEVCPTSNLRTGVVPDLARHPLRALFDAGVAVTLNSDDPAMFHTSLTDEYLVAASMGLSAADLATIAGHGVTASFLPAPDKRRLLTAIADHRIRHSS
jgi:aminodeoxyfutalosine deaminase